MTHDEIKQEAESFFRKHHGTVNSDNAMKDVIEFAQHYVEKSQPQPRLTVRLTSYPESNGKRNWTALFVRTEPFDGLVGTSGGITIARGELWNRVAYEAERAKFLIGERDTEPFILDYGDDIHTPEEWAGEKDIERYKRNKPAPEAA